MAPHNLQLNLERHFSDCKNISREKKYNNFWIGLAREVELLAGVESEKKKRFVVNIVTLQCNTSTNTLRRIRKVKTELDLTPHCIGPGTTLKQGSPLRINKLFNACSATDESKRSPCFFSSDQSVRAVNYFWLCQYLLVCISDSCAPQVFLRDNGSAPSLQKRLRVNGSRGNLCGPAIPVPMTAHWRQDGGMSCVFFFFFFSPVQTSHHDRPSQAPFHSNRTRSGMII